MYAIAGLTGNTGAAAARTLLAAGQKLRGLTRDPAKAAAWAAEGVELVRADVTDAESLTHAFRGVRGAYVLVPPNPTHPDPIGFYAEAALGIRKAALAAELPRLVFLSSAGAHLEEGTGPIRGISIAEKVLKDAAPKLTFLRPSYFQENWRGVLGLAQDQGLLPTMFSDLDRKIPMAAAADIGRVAAELLLDADPPDIVELASGTYSARDAATAVGEALGRQVTPVQPPRSEWLGILKGTGLSGAYARLLAEMYEGINAGRIDFSGQGRKVNGRVTLAETVSGWLPPAPLLQRSATG